MSEHEPSTPPIESAATVDHEPEPIPASKPRPAPEARLPTLWPWQRAWWTRQHLLNVVWVGLVFVVLTVAGRFVQGFAESTGYFGPTVDAIMTRQQENFDALAAKLDALGKTDDPGERQALMNEIRSLRGTQEKLNDQLQGELRDALTQIEILRAEALASRGTSSGADFWVPVNESATVGSRNKVIGVTYIHSNNSTIRVNHEGKAHSLTPGESIDVETDKGTAKVIFKLARDRRAGFDWVPSSGA